MRSVSNCVVSSTPYKEIRILLELLLCRRISILKFGRMNALGFLIYLVTISATVRARGSIVGRVTDSAGLVSHSNAVLTYNNTFVPGGRWLQPLTVPTPLSVEKHGCVNG
jgi:hypothetical protein